MLLRIVLVAVLLLVVAGAALLTAWEIPPPTRHVEIPIADERLAR